MYVCEKKERKLNLVLKKMKYFLDSRSTPLLLLNLITIPCNKGIRIFSHNLKSLQQSALKSVQAHLSEMSF